MRADGLADSLPVAFRDRGRSALSILAVKPSCSRNAALTVKPRRSQIVPSFRVGCSLRRAAAAGWIWRTSGAGAAARSFCHCLVACMRFCGLLGFVRQLLPAKLRGPGDRLRGAVRAPAAQILQRGCALAPAPIGPRRSASGAVRAPAAQILQRGCALLTAPIGPRRSARRCSRPRRFFSADAPSLLLQSELHRRLAIRFAKSSPAWCKRRQSRGTGDRPQHRRRRDGWRQSGRLYG